MHSKSEEAGTGKVVWLEPVQLHFHHGQDVRVKILYGEGMKPGETPSVEEWTVHVSGPAGRLGETRMTVDEGGKAAVVFKAGEEGLYTVTVKSRAGLARVMVPVGHHVSGKGTAGGKGLEIVPLYYHEFHPDDTCEFRVLMNGEPLSGAVVRATYHLYEGPEAYPYQRETNERGLFRFTFKEKGHWLFAVKWGSVFTTLVVPGIH